MIFDWPRTSVVHFSYVFSLFPNSKARTPTATCENASTPAFSLNRTPRKPKEPKRLARVPQPHPNQL